MWSPDDVDGLIDSEDVIKMKERKAKRAASRAATPARRAKKFREKYSDAAAALPDACNALFNLNRYAKWTKCSQKHRDEIYSLKGDLIKLLYTRDYAERVGEHVVMRPGKPCNRCHGSGEDLGDECQKCYGTGNYTEPSELRFVVFRFVVNEHPYAWHQPRDRVTWHYELTANCLDNDWQPAGEPKPLEMIPRDFADAKALIRFALGEH